MKSIIFFILFLFSLDVFSQATFFKKYENIGHERGFECVETSNGGYIIVGEQADDYNYIQYRGIVYRLNQQGDLVAELTLSDSLSNSNLMTINPIPANPGQFVVYGSKRFIDNQDSCSELIQVTIDEDINPLNISTFFSLRDHWSYPWKTELANDSVIYVLISDMIAPWNSARFGVAKIRLPDDSLTSWFSPNPTGTFHLGYDLHIQPDQEVIKVFYFGVSLMESNPLKIARFNPDLSLIGSSLMPGYIINSDPCTIHYNDTSFIFTGTTSHTSLANIQHVVCYKMNEANDSIHDTLEYINSLDTILYSGAGTNTVLNGQSIFIVSMYNIIPTQIPWQTSPMWIQITRLDLDLNLISHHFYGGDAEYLPYCIAPTSDGGAIVTGFVWDYSIPDNYQYDIFALKFDTSGVVTGRHEGESWKASEAILVPNPGIEYCIVLLGAQYKTAELNISDLNGKIVLNRTIDQYQTKISTSHLPVGSYVYSVTANGHLIGSGKWIRQ